jgi:hypothetical protein
MAIALGMAGGMAVIYMGARVGATIIDVANRWRRYRAGDKDAWKVDGEE